MRNLAHQCFDIVESIVSEGKLSLPEGGNLPVIVDLHLSGQGVCEAKDLKAALSGAGKSVASFEDLLALSRLSASFAVSKEKTGETEATGKAELEEARAARVGVAQPKGKTGEAGETEATGETGETAATGKAELEAGETGEAARAGVLQFNKAELEAGAAGAGARAGVLQSKGKTGEAEAAGKTELEAGAGARAGVLQPKGKTGETEATGKAELEAGETGEAARVGVAQSKGKTGETEAAGKAELEAGAAARVGVLQSKGKAELETGAGARAGVLQLNKATGAGVRAGVLQPEGALESLADSILKTYEDADYLVQPRLDVLLQSFEASSSRHYVDADKQGCFDVESVKLLCFVFHLLASHGRAEKRFQFLAQLRPYLDKYVKLLGQLAAIDGLAFTFGRGVGVLTQLYPIELILCAFSEGWVAAKDLPVCLRAVSRLFQNFFLHYFDAETGRLNDRATQGFSQQQSQQLLLETLGLLSRICCLARALNLELKHTHEPSEKRVGKFITFHKTQRKEHGLFFYYNPTNQLKMTLPLVGLANVQSAASLAFPHCPPLMDVPTERCLPTFVPSLRFGKHTVTPSIYGKQCNLKLNAEKQVIFSYRQPELISLEGKMLDIGESQVSWLFADTFFTSCFSFTLNRRVTLEAFHYFVSESVWEKYPFEKPKSALEATLLRDDFKTKKRSLSQLESLRGYRTPWGRLKRIEEHIRSHALTMRPTQPYVFKIRFDLKSLNET